jgi:hypothetical protein
MTSPVQLLVTPREEGGLSEMMQALGCPDTLVTGHEIYQGLGKSPEGRSRACRAMFAQQPGAWPYRRAEGWAAVLPVAFPVLPAAPLNGL